MSPLRFPRRRRSRFGKAFACFACVQTSMCACGQTTSKRPCPRVSSSQRIMANSSTPTMLTCVSRQDKLRASSRILQRSGLKLCVASACRPRMTVTKKAASVPSSISSTISSRTARYSASRSSRRGTGIAADPHSRVFSRAAPIARLRFAVSLSLLFFWTGFSPGHRARPRAGRPKTDTGPRPPAPSRSSGPGERDRGTAPSRDRRLRRA